MVTGPIDGGNSPFYRNDSYIVNERFKQFTQSGNGYCNGKKKRWWLRQWWRRRNNPGRLCVVCGVIAVVILLRNIFKRSRLPDDPNNFLPPLQVDKNGYVVFCPCMGRFGNQADMYLGALDFANALNRTMILPPWIDFPPYSFTSIMVPFDTYFKVNELAKFTKVLTMEKFMTELAPTVWPPSKRIVFCHGHLNDDEDEADCRAKDGNPFGPFWDNHGIDFIHSKYIGSLSYIIETEEDVKDWDRTFPPSLYKVLAFVGAPGSFPVLLEHVHIQKYFYWSNRISNTVERFIDKRLVRPFLGLHMRNGPDWDNVCVDFKDADDSQHHVFSSANCLGENYEHGHIYYELCKPSKGVVLRQVNRAVKKLKMKSVFVASDDDHMLDEFRERMPWVKFVKLPKGSPQTDLAVLSRADHVIANCISTFSSYAVRDRWIQNKTIEYWAFPRESFDL